MDNINLIMHHIVTVNIKTTTNRKTKKEGGVGNEMGKAKL